MAIGLPVLAPTLRDELGLSLTQIGVLLAVVWAGSTVTLLPWGFATDRYGERPVLALGLGVCALCLVAAALASEFTTLLVALTLAGAAGSGVNSASGRAVMHWFGPRERGLALGIRQTAIPLGGLLAALVLPVLTAGRGSEAGFLFFAALCAAGGLVGAVFLRGRDAADGIEPATVARTLRDSRLWQLSVGSGIYVYSQLAIIGFGVVFLVDEHDFSERHAALVIAGAHALGGVLRVATGRWSDLVGSRVEPLRRVGLAIAVSLVLVAVLAGGPIELLVPALAVAGGLSMAWNGLSFAAVAELAGARRSGAAIGVQQSVLGVISVAAPVLFAFSVSATSWAAAFTFAAFFPVAGALFLGALRAH